MLHLYRYSTPLTFLVKKSFLRHRPVLIFQHTRNSKGGDKKTQAVSGPYLSAGKNAQLLSGDGYVSVCGGI
jgi:hypothetical protein